MGTILLGTEQMLGPYQRDVLCLNFVRSMTQDSSSLRSVWPNRSRLHDVSHTRAHAQRIRSRETFSYHTRVLVASLPSCVMRWDTVSTLPCSPV